MDNSSIIDGLDYSVDTYVEKKRAGNFFTDMWANQDMKQVSNVLGSFSTSGAKSEKFTFNAAKDSQAANI